MGGHNSSGTSTKSKRGETKGRPEIGTSKMGLSQGEMPMGSAAAEENEPAPEFRKMSSQKLKEMLNREMAYVSLKRYLNFSNNAHEDGLNRLEEQAEKGTISKELLKKVKTMRRDYNSLDVPRDDDAIKGFVKDIDDSFKDVIEYRAYKKENKQEIIRQGKEEINSSIVKNAADVNVPVPTKEEKERGLKALESIQKNREGNPFVLLKPVFGRGDEEPEENVYPDESEIKNKPESIAVVPIDLLYSQQDSVDYKGVKEKIKNFESGELPLVLAYKGRLLVDDGNHRIMARMLMGHKDIKVKMVDVATKESTPTESKKEQETKQWKKEAEGITHVSVSGEKIDFDALKPTAVGDKVVLNNGARYTADDLDGEYAFPGAIRSYEIKEGYVFYHGNRGEEGIVGGSPQQIKKWMEVSDRHVEKPGDAKEVNRAWTPSDGGEHNIHVVRNMMEHAAKVFAVPVSEVNFRFVEHSRNPVAGGHRGESFDVVNAHLDQPAAFFFEAPSLNFGTAVAAHEMAHKVFSIEPELGKKALAEYIATNKSVSMYHAIGGAAEGLMEAAAAYLCAPEELKKFNKPIYNVIDRWAKARRASLVGK